MTETRAFQPLPARLAGLPIDQTLYDDVPDRLYLPLWDWLDAVFKDQGKEGAERLARRVPMRLRWAKDHSQQSYVERLEMARQAETLTVVDAVVQLHPAWTPRTAIVASLFRVHADGPGGHSDRRRIAVSG